MSLCGKPLPTPESERNGFPPTSLTPVTLSPPGLITRPLGIRSVNSLPSSRALSLPAARVSVQIVGTDCALVSVEGTRHAYTLMRVCGKTAAALRRFARVRQGVRSPNAQEALRVGPAPCSINVSPFAESSQEA